MIFHITQPTLSYHMKILTESGLVNSRKEGAWIRYSINDDVITSINEFWNQIITEQNTCICYDTKEVGKCD